MNEQEWSLSQNKDKRVIKPLRAVFYERAQIVEAVRGVHVYYLFFYKETYVTAIQATKVKYNSFLGRAFRNGFICDAPHPLIERLNLHKPFPTSTYTSLLQHLSGKYTHQEQVYILTFLESFLSKKKLLEEMKNLFYDIRRKGKMFEAYKIIRVLMDFAPNHRFVKELSHDLHFQQFEETYDLPPMKLWEKDPLHAEKQMFHDRDDRLLTVLKKTHPLEYTAFALLTFNEGKSHYEDYDEVFRLHFTSEEQLQIVEHAYQLVPSDEEAKQRLLSGYLEKNRLNDVFLLLEGEEAVLTPKECRKAENALLTERSLVTSLPVWERYLREIFRVRTEAKEQLIHAFVREVLPSYPVADVRAALEKFEGIEETGTYENIRKMEEWQDELDRMEELGRLYYEFEQKEKALECFQYASEMKPEEVAPVQWLAKIYKDLGQEQEAETYRELTKQIKKLSL
ncbi:hypothetical protein [Salimicrobium flavidum]|uniref:Uncharacterized protein n=1 Tax=Salimicrobium flavidum TaxID=570947 RepID=A0A1N7KVZ0_9BACI|nr:hypothetical protein [Salimicrobium flavidum]SIS65768.1 hypothetical protein SAMN05421687_1213 [Salimicrobium flavidum]